MRLCIRLVFIIPRVPRHVDIARQHSDVVERRHDPRQRVDVILGADVHVSDRSGRQSGHRVVVMRHAVVAAFVLLGDVIAQDGAGNARRAVRVHIGGRAGFSDLGGGDGGDGAAEAVTDDADLVVWIGRGGSFEGGEDALAGFEPAVVTGGFLVFFFSDSFMGAGLRTSLGDRSKEDRCRSGFWQSRNQQASCARNETRETQRLYVRGCDRGLRSRSRLLGVHCFQTHR